jgi:hypothetical protein
VVTKITRADLKGLIAHKIADSVIHAALFSTYTFNRFFFEEEIFEGLLCSHGQHRGTFPTTILMDRINFHGHGWGYDVCCSPDDRLWHPKVVALMLRERTRSAQARTVFIAGSGNLTPSGWERNQEIFLVLEWAGWVLPDSVEQWILPKTGFGFKTAFGQWYDENHFGRVPKFIENKLFSNYGQESIWRQWEWSGDSWTKAYIVTPFTDARAEEKNDNPRGYFSELVKYANSSKARLCVYLQSTPDGRVIGHWRTFDWLRNKVQLQVYSVGDDQKDRPLHAKLQVINAGGVWHILGGSPNATGNAMLMEKAQKGNVELAWQTVTDRLPDSVFPHGTPVQLKKSNFVEPSRTALSKRWRALKSVTYYPKSQRLVPHWLPGHNLVDTQVLLADKEIGLPAKVTLGTERAIATLPRDTNLNRGFVEDWVPIEYPYVECDDPVFDKAWSLEEYFALLAGCDENDMEVNMRTLQETMPSAPSISNDTDGFEWHERVTGLERALANLKKRIDELDSPLEASYWLKMVKGCLEATDLPAEKRDPFESSWREWVRLEICRCLLSLDKRKRTSKPFVKVAREWEKKIRPLLRKSMEICI